MFENEDLYIIIMEANVPAFCSIFTNYNMNLKITYAQRGRIKSHFYLWQRSLEFLKKMIV